MIARWVALLREVQVGEVQLDRGTAIDACTTRYAELHSSICVSLYPCPCPCPCPCTYPCTFTCIHTYPCIYICMDAAVLEGHAAVTLPLRLLPTVPHCPPLPPTAPRWPHCLCRGALPFVCIPPVCDGLYLHAPPHPQRHWQWRQQQHLQQHLQQQRQQ
mmetsp:Transcript_5763/g.13196  ORF Transcript_5763/g.13196 Transcript_5763/m.13196 type:complete len:159 (+) Transcript_5763:243-719(+)